jgi:hypothetical protein
MRVLIRRNGEEYLRLSDAVMEDGVVIRGFVENGAWDYELRDGEVLAKDYHGHIVTRQPLPNNFTYEVLED